VGFSEGYRYNGSAGFLPRKGVASHGGYSWWFATDNVGFYTYPNPYKPGIDSRHRREGGVWFKNLHTLEPGLTDVIIRIYTMNTHPVFDSEKAGIRIHFEEDNPDALPSWKWEAVNTRGSRVATGVYLYGIFDPDEKLLIKGKLLVVR
jgi:hypothetical protein